MQYVLHDPMGIHLASYGHSSGDVAECLNPRWLRTVLPIFPETARRDADGFLPGGRDAPWQVDLFGGSQRHIQIWRKSTRLCLWGRTPSV